MKDGGHGMAGNEGGQRWPRAAEFDIPVFCLDQPRDVITHFSYSAGRLVQGWRVKRAQILHENVFIHSVSPWDSGHPGGETSALWEETARDDQLMIDGRSHPVRHAIRDGVEHFRGKFPWGIVDLRRTEGDGPKLLELRRVSERELDELSELFRRF
jgi:hypothetical protein